MANNPLKEMEYPGRFIVTGMSPEGFPLVAYGVTGRSPSSQARRLTVRKYGLEINVEPTDESIVNQGNRDLLVYPAVVVDPIYDKDWIAVSNGAHTRDIAKQASLPGGPAHILETALRSWSYEPDEPNFTPRISGFVNTNTLSGGIYILRKGDGEEAERINASFSLQKGRGKLVATYKGINQDPVPSFEQPYLNMETPWSSAEEAAQALYAALAPEDPEKDFRVGVAVILVKSSDDTSDGKTLETKVINRHI